jgi:hypothetical protein
MRRTIIILGMLVLVLVACGDNPPPTQIVIVISPTPETVTPGTPDNVVTASPSPTIVPTAAPTVTGQPTAQRTRKPNRTPVPTETLIPTATPRPAIFPTDVVADVQLAEQVFEHGRTFWIRHTRQIWVMQASPDDPDGGDWFCYDDTFEDGEQEVDPSLIPPLGMYQPRRGFGKLWRSHPEIREGLGWALTPEFELTSSYLYIAGGTVEGDQYLPGPGEHRLTTLYKQSISFYEGDIRGDCQGGTWHMTPPE